MIKFWKKILFFSKTCKNFHSPYTGKAKISQEKLTIVSTE